jgi:primary-amine oxidase
VFEQEMPYLMQRHSSASYVSATKNIALTVRSVSTVGNYDYQFEYNFFTDGSIETVVRASGYIQSAFFANNTEYGYQIHDALSGSMHDHALQFKVDMDIKGVNNTLVKHAFEPADVKYKWSNVTRSTMKKVITEVTNEDEGKMASYPLARG